MKKMRSVVMENISIYYLKDSENNIENCVSIVWKSPAEKNDNNKTVCPVGHMYLRLWDFNGTVVLSQSIKHFTGAGDIIINPNISVNLNELSQLSEKAITEFMFKEKGGFSPLEKTMIQHYRK